MHFYLHGWRIWWTSEKNTLFFQELCKYGKNILIFPFGADEEEAGYAEYQERFLKHNPDKALSLECADHDIPHLIDQIARADILFFFLREAS